MHLFSLFLPGIAQRPAQLQWLAALGTQGTALHRLHDELRRASRLECHVPAARLVVHPRAHHLAPLSEFVERGPDLSLRPGCRQAAYKYRRGLSAVAHAAEHIPVDAIRRVDKPLLLCHARQAMERFTRRTRPAAAIGPSQADPRIATAVACGGRCIHVRPTARQHWRSSSSSSRLAAPWQVDARREVEVVAGSHRAVAARAAGGALPCRVKKEQIAALAPSAGRALTVFFRVSRADAQQLSPGSGERLN